MSSCPMLPQPTDLRGFGWRLWFLETRFDAELETARQALALLQRRRQEFEHVVRQATAHHAQQLRAAAECLQRAPAMRAPVLGYLGEVEARLAQAQAQASELQRQLDGARADCVMRQRKLACVQRLRESAQRSHLQEWLRREAREADAAWAAGVQRRAAAQVSGRAEWT